MPYIKQEVRKDLCHRFAEPRTPGELNYMVTDKCLAYLDLQRESYQTYNDIIGVLECAKQEFYRKLVSKYEDKKCTENGEVYQYE